jgi:hypothetical protein
MQKLSVNKSLYKIINNLISLKVEPKHLKIHFSDNNKSTEKSLQLQQQLMKKEKMI